MDEKHIGMEIRILANMISRCLNEIGFSKEHNNLTGPQGLVLGYLCEHQNKDIFQKDIELTFNIRRSRLLQCLESNGYIERVNVGYDARLKQIVLTNKAYEFSNTLEAHIQKLEKILVKDLDEQEINDLIRLMSKIKKNLE